MRRLDAGEGLFPRMLWLRGHNHQSSTVSIGSSEDSLGPDILRFIADTASDEHAPLGEGRGWG